MAHVVEQAAILSAVLVDKSHRWGSGAHAGHGDTSFWGSHPAYTVPNMTDEGSATFLNGGTDCAGGWGQERRCPMPKLLAARPALDAAEDRQVRRLARSLHAPADWVLHARMVVRSWDGLRTRLIAEELGCHP